TGTHIQKVSFTRVPLRFGADTFGKGFISDKKIRQLSTTMKAFWYLMEVHDVVSFRACATSAMREAKNGKEVVKHIFQDANLPIEIISGKEEADLIFGNFDQHKIDITKSYLYIDVGGGSTELSIIKKGVRVKSKSFRLGTVRALEGKTKPAEWRAMKDWVEDEILSKDSKYTAIGTGGNINRVYKMSRRKMLEPISMKELKEIHEFISKYSVEERITQLRLKPDRADVITHATEIYIRVMELAGVKKMIVPKVGLSDGIVVDLYQKHLAALS
ncbi:MAG: exopolyphosphatase, partial [Flavobacteriales bacterium]|nr:exopolyphosphatase [Flavobacteriales bacterium]